MTSPVPTVRLVGLEMPATLAARIIAAARATYPALTAGRNDDAAVRAVLKFWIESLLVTHEGAQAESPVDQAVQDLRKNYAQQGERARQKAKEDAKQIVESPTPPSPTA